MIRPMPAAERSTLVRPRAAARASRRGVLLLVVLSMLTLFLMLGAAYIVAATRAREAARAYARLTFGGDEVRVPHARLLDAILLEVLAGGTAAVRTTGSPSIPLASAFESLLADKYGLDTLSGTATSLALSGPVIVANVTLPSVRPADLNGRVLTLVEPGRPATSHRIVRARGPGDTNATATTFTLSLDVPVRTASFTLPASGSARVIVNGREFAGEAPWNEGWDGYDFDANQFLAQVRTSTAAISSSTVLRGSYVRTGTAGVSAGTFMSGTSGPYSFTSGTNATQLSTATDFDGDLIPDAADNDNDGVVDGVFLDFGIPDTIDTYGNAVQIRASVLVLPLDGRFNVNAHGSLNPILYSAAHGNWSSASGVTGTLTNVPMGSGYGPAEIQSNLGFRDEPNTSAALLNSGSGAARLFDGGTLQPNENPRWTLTVGIRHSAQNGRRPAGSRYTVSGSTPRLPALEAKYGEQSAASTATPGSSIQLDESGFRFARPGEPDADDEVSRITDRRAFPSAGAQVNFGIPSRWWNGLVGFDWGQPGSTTPLPRGIFNSPPDLHGRMKTFALAASGSGVVPQMVFAQPEWSNSTTPRETKDDPYEIKLDTRRGFGGLLSDPSMAGTGTNAWSVARDNPFTPAELEPVLRPYDIDTNRLPPRLAAMLGSAAEESRLQITTDSWDTTAITGSAAIAIFGAWLPSVTGTLYGAGSSASLGGVIGGEVSRGEKFDLNRALAASGTVSAGYSAAAEYTIQRQAYFKDLYTLLVALSPTTSGSTLAQWAANVVEFRDADSRTIPFEYDTSPANGWGVDGDVTTADGGSERAVVWGVERPEILIREAFAWRNSLSGSAGMAIVLHRPWNAKAYAAGSANIIDAEPCDYALDTIVSGKPTNQVDLGKKANPAVLTPGSFTASVYNDVSGTTYPIWRLRLVAGGSTTYVRFDTGTAAANEHVLDPAIANGGDKPKLAVDTTLTLVSGTTISTGSAESSGTAWLNVTGPTRTVGGMRLGASGTVYIERLADPSGRPSAADWSANPTVGANSATSAVRYLVVDESPVALVDVSGASAAAQTRVRSTTPVNQAFWRPPGPGVIGTIQNNAVLGFPSPLDSGSTNKTAWLPWPNRPFVSSAELLLVPQGTAAEILWNYRRLTTADSGTTLPGGGAPVPLDLLFDAVHVPTRFAGIHTTATNTQPGQTGIDTTITTVNQFSSFREPGRVNLNVVPGDDVWNAVVAGPLAAPVVTGTRARLGLTAAGDWSPVPATSLFRVLALSGTGATVVSDTTTTVSGTAVAMDTNVLAWDKNPLHEIYTAVRLANTATPRSNVFGVWITLRESVPTDPDSVKLHRAFYIVDRSIPVGFQPGRALNAWNCVRLRRIIE